MKPQGTLVLNRSEVAALLSVEECISAVEHAFRWQAEGKAPPPGILGMRARDGGFHIKAGLLELGKTYFAAKVNANFPENRRRFGLPLIQGIIVLCDALTGYPLALMDSMEITAIRTGAATGVAARLLARGDARVATICGCGTQGRISLRALACVRPLTRAYAFDIDVQQAKQFADELSAELGIDVEPVRDLAQAVRASDICVTCTPSRNYYLKREDVPPGIFIAAVGADSEAKQELEPALMARGKIVVDLLEQCAVIGDLHHAIAQGLLTKSDVHAELGEVVSGKKPGRTSDDEVVIFDSTGIALQDVAAASIVYDRAVDAGKGIRIDLGE